MMTQFKYYQEQQAKCPDSLLLMKEGEAYYIIGNKAHDVLPIAERTLTHKDVGKMYCYDPDNYAYPTLSFGKHNIKPMLSALIYEDYKVILIDFDKAFKESGGWEEIDRIMKEQEQERIEYERKHQQPVQLSLFDTWNI